MRSHWRSVVAICAIIAGVYCGRAFGSEDEHDHDHDSEETLFEQAAVYEMESIGDYSIIVVPGEGETTFEEDYFVFMVVSTSENNEDGLEEAEEAAEESWEAYLEGTRDEVDTLEDGEVATPSESTVYEVALEDPLIQIVLTIEEVGAYAVLVEHGSEEMLVVVTSPMGEVLEAGAEEGVDEEEEDDSSAATGRQWANALVASFVVSFCSFAGLVIVVSKRVAYNIDLSHAAIFAAGALLTASLLHIIPEALEGLESEFEDNLHGMGIAAGVAILAGISLGVILHAFLDAGHSHGPADTHHHHNDTRVDGNEGESTPAVIAVKAERGEQDLLPVATANQAQSGGTVTDAALVYENSITRPPSPSDDGRQENLQFLMESRRGKSLLDVKNLQPVCWNIIIGDLVHNFADGVTIGAAFMGCSTTIGWTVTASAVLHEIPHELADFMALINGGMSKPQAFFFNFISALSAVLGVVVVLALQETLTSADVSYILLIGGGSFIFIALAELVPEGLTVSRPGVQKKAGFFSPLLKLVSFLVGAIIIGIPLLFDEHCENGETGHDH